MKGFSYVCVGCLMAAILLGGCSSEQSSDNIGGSGAENTSGEQGGASGVESSSGGHGDSADTGNGTSATGEAGAETESDAATISTSDTGITSSDAGIDTGWEIDTYDDGALIWAKRIGGLNLQEPTDISVMPDGSFLVTGFFYDEAVFAPGEPAETRITDQSGGGALFIARYTSEGELVWVTQAGGPEWDIGESIYAFSDGSSLITGTINGNATFGAGEANQTLLLDEDGQGEAFVAKYSSEGELVWARQAIGSDEDYSRSVAASSDGSAFIAGAFKDHLIFDRGGPKETILSNETSLHGSAFIAKYQANGDFAWATQVGGDGQSHCVGIDVLSNGDVFITGSFSQTVIFGQGEANQTELTATSVGFADMFVARYNSDGTLAWVRRNRTNRNSDGWEVDVLADGTSYVSGHIQDVTAFGMGEDIRNILDAGEGQDAFVARYDPDGNLDWVRQGACPKGAESESVSAFVDGSVVITGRYQSEIVFGAGESTETVLTTADNFPDIFVARYDPDGTLVWAKSINGDSYDYAHAVDLLPNGWSMVVGYIWKTNIFGAGEANEISLTADDSNDGFIAKFAQ